MIHNDPPSTTSQNAIRHILGNKATLKAKRQSASLMEEEKEINQLLYGEIYEIVEIPDSMTSTTIFIGNLCEFITDDELSNLFQQISVLNYIPAFIVRKPNGSSLNYGFATFPTISEKELAIETFHAYNFNNKIIKVEEIDRCVRVPGKLVDYVVGNSKTTLDGRINTLRRSSQDPLGVSTKKKKKKKKRSSTKYKLDDHEQKALFRAKRYGFMALDSTGYRRGRKGSAFCNMHRDYCDNNSMPQIILCKASAGRRLDNVIIDLSPLRIDVNSDDSISILMNYHDQIINIAKQHNMIINPSIEEDNTITIEVCNGIISTECLQELGQWSFQTDSIENLPVLSQGVFEGERHDAKGMVKELAKLWDTVDENAEMIGVDSKKRKGGKSKMKSLRRFRE